MIIGIPRALLYYRYKVLWETYFRELGIETVLSPTTNKTILEAGDRYAIDENCLSSKLFFGHVSMLEGKCDLVFVPRIANYAGDGMLCSRFEGLYDLCVNTFRETGLKFISCNVDLQQKAPEEKAYIQLGQSLGKSKGQAKAAFRKAYAAWQQDLAHTVSSQQTLLTQEGMKVLIVGHNYNLYDEYIGKPILKGIRDLKAIPICSDAVDLTQAQTDYMHICERVPWIMNRELLAAIHNYRNQVDGIVLITAFPCGPDSMVNEMIIRRVNDLPILCLTLDSQDGNAGIETRLESFIDIIRFRKGVQL